MGRLLSCSCKNRRHRLWCAWWRSVKRSTRNRSGGVCERCKTNTARHVHHLHYLNFGAEKPADLQHVCLTCHGIYHPHHNFAPPGMGRGGRRKAKQAKAKKRRHTQLPKAVPAAQDWADYKKLLRG